MSRRALLGAALAAGWPRPRRGPAATELLLRGALLLDGSGRPPSRADVLVRGDRVAAVRPRLEAGGARVIDLGGLALAPGFVDVHSHSDRVLTEHPRSESKVRQGVTTEVVGADGGSLVPGDLLGRLESGPPAVNVASMVGAGTLRRRVVGDADRPATGPELAAMVALAETARAEGACGLSSGLEYTPGAFASLDELAALARGFGRAGLPYMTHMRNEDDTLLAAVEEAIEVGRRAGCPVQISHLKNHGQRNWWKTGAVLEAIDAAAAAGLDVRFDVYPYVAWNTWLGQLFPLWARDGGIDAFLARLADPDTGLQRRMREVVEDKVVGKMLTWDAVLVTGTASDTVAWARGRRLGALARERGTEPYQLVRELLLADRNRTTIAGFGMREDDVARFLAHPRSMVCSDGSGLATTGPLAAGSPHPRNFGAFPRVLGHYVRERKVLSLEAAIHKMTDAPARRVRLAGRGRIAAGGFADLVAFDPGRVADRATFETPLQYPEGILHVWVNGTLVLRDGEHTGATPGRVVRPAAGGTR